MSPILQDWPQPETWRVGDTIDAATWTRRVYEPLGLLLRRPITVLRRTTTFSAAGNTGSNPITFDTVDIDDDGMVIDALPQSTIYTQRSGIFGISYTAPITGNGAATGNAVGVRILVNGSNLSTRQSVSVGTTVGQDEFKSLSCDLALNEGDAIQMCINNFNAAAVTVAATLLSPRVVVMWKRPA